MKPLIVGLALAVLHAGLNAQIGRRAFGVDGLALLRDRGVGAAVEPAAWNHVTLRFAFLADEANIRTNSTTPLRAVDTRYEEELRSGSVSVRAWPLVLHPRTGPEVILPFVGAGLRLAERTASGSRCVSTFDPDYPALNTRTCTDLGARVRRVSPLLEGGVRLTPGGVYLEGGGQLEWGRVGDLNSAPGSGWRFRAGLAIGYAW